MWQKNCQGEKIETNLLNCIGINNILAAAAAAAAAAEDRRVRR